MVPRIFQVDRDIFVRNHRVKRGIHLMQFPFKSNFVVLSHVKLVKKVIPLDINTEIGVTFSAGVRSSGSQVDVMLYYRASCFI